MSTPFAPEQAPAADGQQQQADPGQGQGQGQQPGGDAQQQGADPRVLQQMQSQLEQFGGVVGQMAEYLPAVQQLAQQQQPQGQQQPSLEDQLGQALGWSDPYAQQPGYDPYAQQPGYDPYAQQPQFDPYTGQPLVPDPYAQQYGQPPQQYGQPFPVDPRLQAQQAPQGDPAQVAELFRSIVRQELTPFQQAEQQRAWEAFYTEFPDMRDQERAAEVAPHIARAAQTFGSSEAEAQRLASNPGFVRFALLASLAEQQGRGENVAGSGDGINPLESPGGASAVAAPEEDPGDGIVNAGRAAGQPQTIWG